MRHCRFAGRSTARSTVRRATRIALRTRWRAPDELAAALAAFRRALQAHRRLARLAPRFFDSQVVERERREREARSRWRALCEPALDRVYGAESKPSSPPSDLPPLPPPRTQRAVDQELASWNSWLKAGHLALERHAQRRPHALVSLTQITRLLELGFAFARLACGADPNVASAAPDPYEAAWADLERAYGPPGAAAPSALVSPPAPAEMPRPGVTVQGAEGSVPERREATPGCCAPGQMPQGAAPGPTTQPRRDAWSSWARHRRRLP